MRASILVALSLGLGACTGSTVEIVEVTVAADAASTVGDPSAQTSNGQDASAAGEAAPADPPPTASDGGAAESSATQTGALDAGARADSDASRDASLDASADVSADAPANPWWTVTANAGMACPAGTTCPLRVLYNNQLPADASATQSMIRIGIELANGSDAGLPVSGLTVRYYFLKGGCAPFGLAYYCSQPPGCPTMVTTSMSTPTHHADTYVEMTFADFALASQAATGNDQLGISASGSATACSFDQLLDWSYLDYLRADMSYGFAMNMTAYLNGTLVWGIEPTPTTDP